MQHYTSPALPPPVNGAPWGLWLVALAVALVLGLLAWWGLRHWLAPVPLTPPAVVAPALEPPPARAPAPVLQPEPEPEPEPAPAPPAPIPAPAPPPPPTPQQQVQARAREAQAQVQRQQQRQDAIRREANRSFDEYERQQREQERRERRYSQ